MNPAKHCDISVHRHGGNITDYYDIHSFMDSTKEICADNRHRFLHTIWGIRKIVIPIFGHTITNSNAKKVNVKDLCERDHILPDFHNRFIPTLHDFSTAINEDKLPTDYKKRIGLLHQLYQDQPKISQLLMSPLSHTGHFKALLFTHNSWFLNEILPQIHPECAPKLMDFALSPADLFAAMSFELWMDNGMAYPPSAAFRETKFVSSQQ